MLDPLEFDFSKTSLFLFIYSFDRKNLEAQAHFGVPSL